MLDDGEKLIRQLRALLGEEAVSAGLAPRKELEAHAAVDTLASELALRRIGEGWREIDRESARALLTETFAEDLAYGTPLLPRAEAIALAEAFDGLFGASTRCFCNRSGAGWTPLTDATFDTGIALVDAERVGVVCVNAED